MPRIEVDGVSIAYELIGEIVGEGRPWVLTPGGRFSKDYPGVRELAVALAEPGNRVLIWDRPNCGESEVCFRGDSESEMQADILAGLAPRARHDAGGGHRRFGRRARLVARRESTSRRRRGSRHLVDQWWCLRLAVVGRVLLRAGGAGGVERRPGSGDVDPELRGDVRAAPAEPRTAAGAGSAGVHRHHGAMDGGVLQLWR